VLHELEKEELIRWDITRIAPTPRGTRYLNDVLLRFLPD